MLLIKEIILFTGHVVVNRCSGSCFPSSQECLPLETANMTIRVMAVRSTFTSGGSWENVCAEIVIEKHIRQAIGCFVYYQFTSKGV